MSYPAGTLKRKDSVFPIGGQLQIRRGGLAQYAEAFCMSVTGIDPAPVSPLAISLSSADTEATMRMTQ